MGQGYVRNDSSNGISDGGVINAALFDGEFDSLVGAFAAVTGHTHDGTTAEGGPISVIGPAQDFIASAAAFIPKSDNTYDLGSVSNEIRDLYVDRFAYIDGLVCQETATFVGATIANLGTVTTANIDGGTIDGTAIGSGTPSTVIGTTITANTGFVGNLTGNVTGNITGTTTGNHVGTLSVTGGSITGITDLSIADGGTGASTAPAAVANLGFTQTAAQISNYLVPQGGIIMWSGSVAAVPTGWALCDGSNGTPDLRGRFIIGAGGAYAVAATGGAETVTLAEANLPAHTHGFGTLAVASGGSHTHTLASASAASGGNSFSINSRRQDGTNSIFSGASGITLTESGAGGSFTRVGSGGGTSAADNISYTGTHTHTLSGTTDSGGAHTHTLSGATASIGSGTAVENRPPYYALAYIMKL